MFMCYKKSGNINYKCFISLNNYSKKIKNKSNNGNIITVMIIRLSVVKC